MTQHKTLHRDVPSERERALAAQIGALRRERETLRAALRSNPADATRIECDLRVVTQRVRALERVRDAAAIPPESPVNLDSKTWTVVEGEPKHRLGMWRATKPRTAPRRWTPKR